MNLPLDTDLDFYFLDHERMENVDEYFSENHEILRKFNEIEWNSMKFNEKFNEI